MSLGKRREFGKHNTTFLVRHVRTFFARVSDVQGGLRFVRKRTQFSTYVRQSDSRRYNTKFCEL